MAVIESSSAVDVKAQTQWGRIQQRHCAIGAQGVGAAHSASRGADGIFSTEHIAEMERISRNFLHFLGFSSKHKHQF